MTQISEKFIQISEKFKFFHFASGAISFCGSCGGLMVSVLDSRVSGLGSSPG